MQKYIGVIRQNTNRLLDLTTQLLDFQKLGNERPELRYETVDITNLIKTVVERFEMTIVSKNKNLIIDLPQKSIMAHIDKEAITKIISNLLNNALKYSTSRIEVRLSEESDMFRLEVVSDGNKISGDDVYHIFEPFYQIDKNGYNQGVGIGLPLTRTLASMHGGSIELENLEGPDNTFVLRIPLKQESVVTEKVETNPTMTEYVMDDQSLLTTPEAGYSLLFVDDNDEMREFLYDQLSKSFVVETAASGVEALEKLKDHKFDIIVTDIMMPEMDGYEFCRRVKEDSDLSHIPVVFLTAKNDLESKVKALKTGGEAYIEKPFSIKYFRQQVMSLLDNRRHERKAFLNKPFFSVDNMKLNKAEEEFMGKVIDIINRNIDDENFSVESMADALCMSRSS
ncbi:MAG: response regulator, partial [Muribaculaceae bacterium]|nr:response regulator [Muribaculaceae bacterium]